MPSAEDTRKTLVLKSLESYGDLFYEPPSLNLDATAANYPGTLHINSALQSKSKIFKINNPSPTKAKKIIVITDWTINDRYMRTDGRYYFLLPRMHRNMIAILSYVGFDIRYYNGVDVVKAELPYSSLNIKPASDKKLINLLVNQNPQGNISSDAILNLDFFALRQLVFQKYADIFTILEEEFDKYLIMPPSVSYSDVQTFLKENQADFEDWIKDKNFSYNLVVGPETPKEAIDFLLKYKNQIVGVLVQNRTQEDVFPLLLNLPNVKDINVFKMSNNYPQVDRYDRKLVAPHGACRKLTALTLVCHAYTEDIFISLLNNYPHISELTLMSSTVMYMSFIPDRLWLKSLTQLEIKSTTVSFRLFKLLLSNKLVRLKLDYATIAHQTPVENDFGDFSMLKDFEVGVLNGDVVKPLLNNLNQKATQLQKLTIGTTSSPFFVTKNSAIKNLRELNLNSRNQNPFENLALETLLYNNQDLECMAITERQVFSFSPEFMKNKLVLSKLTHLNLKSQRNEFEICVSLREFLKLHEIAKNIDAIDLRTISHFADNCFPTQDELDAYDLRHIKRIECDSSRLPGRVIFTIINLCTEAEILNLTNLSFPQVDAIPDNLLLEKLKRLNLNDSGTFMAGRAINKLLERCPNLTELHLNRCDLRDFDIPNPRKPIQSVHYISISMSVRALIALIKYCDSMRSIDIFDFACVLDDETLALFDTVNLDKIETLIIPPEQAAGRFIKKLLPRLTNLTTIETEYISCVESGKRLHLSEDVIGDDFELQRVTSISLVSWVFSGKTFNKLMKAFPNLQNLHLKNVTIKPLQSEDVEDLILSPNLHVTFSDLYTEYDNWQIFMGKVKYTSFGSPKSLNNEHVSQYRPLLNEIQLESTKVVDTLPVPTLNRPGQDLISCSNQKSVQQSSMAALQEFNINLTSSLYSRRIKEPRNRVKHNIPMDVEVDEVPKRTVTQYFTPPEHPSTYRLTSGTKLKHKGKRVKPVAEIDDLEDVKIEFVDSMEALTLQFGQKVLASPDRYRLCTKRMSVTNWWRPLPSLTPYEEIQLCFLLKHEKYQIKYSKKNNLYFIRKISFVHGKVKIEISYLLDKFKSVPKSLQSLPPEIQFLIRHCEDFKKKPFGAPEHFDSYQILQKRYHEQSGACGVRSIVFKHRSDLLKQSKPKNLNNLSTRYMGNKIHAFVEVAQNGVFTKFDLGGYPAKLEVRSSQVALPVISERVNKALKIRNNEKSGPSLQDSGGATLFTPPTSLELEEKDLNPKLAIWRKSKQTFTTDDIVEKIPRLYTNTLIKLEHPDDCLSVVSSFNQKYPNTPYLFIDNADDLQINCKGLKNGTHNELHIEDKFTRLNEFIKQHPNGVLFINWSRFTRSEIAALHCIIDKKRNLEGSPFSETNPIVSFYSDNVKDPYKELDFYSRQHSIFTWPTNNEPVDLYRNGKIATSEIPQNSIPIKLYESSDWESLLFGDISIQNKTFTHNPSEFLQQPLKNLHLVNPPFHMREFDLFWQSALQQRQFSVHGKIYKLADDFKLTYSKYCGYNPETVIEDNEDVSAQFTLNNQTISSLFPHYIYKNGSFVDRPSFFASKLVKKLKQVCLTVTENLSEQQWLRILDTAEKAGVKLKLLLAPGVTLPQALSKLPFTRLAMKAKPLQSQSDLAQTGITLLHCKESSEQVAKSLAQAYPSAEYVSFTTAHHFGDLFYSIHSQITKEKEVLAEFKESSIWQMLQAGKTVIVEGDLPPVFIQTLAHSFLHNEIMIEGKPHQYSGKLIFVTNTDIPFASNKITCESSEEISSLFQLESSNTDKNKTADHLDYSPMHIDSLSLEACEAYKDNRFERIAAGFEKSPIIFYSGATGVGKSTYILNDFSAEYEKKTGRAVKLYIGEDSIKDFAKHQDLNVDPILFVDEANLSTENLSFLKGLRAPQPHLLIEGLYSPIAKNAKVILAGNNKSYGGVRHQQAFIEQYCEEVVCDKPNYAYLYHTILKPILEDALGNTSSTSTQVNTPAEDVGMLILQIFEDINKMNGLSDPYFSPRHLHMMGMVFKHYYETYGQRFGLEPLALASVLTILGDGLPHLQVELNEYLSAKENMHEYMYFQGELYEAARETTKNLVQPENPAERFTYTNSRVLAIQQINTFLAMRHEKGFHFGLALEGSTSTGKSDLLYHYLNSLCPDEVVHMSLGTNYETDRETILKAFNAGKILVVDEINAGGPKYEKLFNTLMMGKDESGNPPTKSGFMVVTTQNSLKLAGRQVLSPALKARFTPITLPKYRYYEMRDILINKGVEESKANQLMKDYEDCIKYAKRHHIKLRPKLRNLLKAAGLHPKAKNPQDLVETLQGEIKEMLQARIYPSSRLTR